MTTAFSRGLNLMVPIAGVAAVAILAGCSNGGADEPTATATLPERTITTPTADAEVESIVWGLSAGEPTTLDPQGSGDYSPKTIAANLCESLMLIDADGSVRPHLASSVETPDDLTIVITIREGVTFWDDTPLTASDVAYSLSRNVGPESTSAFAADFLSVASVEATGEAEVVITLSTPDPLLVNKLGMTGTAIGQEAFIAAAGSAYGSSETGVMCTGPYRFASWTPGSNITIERNDAWWNTEITPKVQEIRFDFVGDNDTLTTALLSGQLDGAYDVPTGSISALVNSDQGSLYRGESTISVLLGPTQPSGPGADAAFREALNLVIDKQAIASLAAGGAGEPMKSMISPFVWSGSQAADIYDAGYEALEGGQRIEAAQAKLEEMTEPLDGPVTLAIIAGSQLMERAATLVQADAAKIGVQIDIEQLQPVVYSSIYTDASVREQYDLFASSGAFVEVPNPYYWVPYFVTSWGPFNYSGYSDPAVTPLIEEGALVADEAAQAELYVEAQSVFAVDGPIIGLTTLDELLFMNDRISGAPASSFYLNYPWAASLGGTE